MARQSVSSSWMDNLPIVMLGVRTAWRTELDRAPCELVFGTKLAVPGSFFESRVDREALPSEEFVEGLMRSMVELQPTQMAHHTSPKAQVPQSLEKTTHVFIRTDAVRPPLVRPYTGPYEVLSKSAKFFTVLKNGKPDTVSTDRLKPVFFQDKTGDVIRQKEKAASSNDNNGVRNPVVPGQQRARGRPKKERARDTERLREKESSQEKTDPVITTTRSGRISKRPSRS